MRHARCLWATRLRAERMRASGANGTRGSSRRSAPPAGPRNPTLRRGTPMSAANYEVIEVEGGVPIKAWMRGVRLRGRGASAARQRRAAAVRPRLGRGDARRALGHRRDGRQRDPDARRDHPGRGRRRHRLRHDGGADEPHGERSAREPARTAPRDRARGPARPHGQPRRARQGRVAGRARTLAGGLEGARRRLPAHRREAPDDQEREPARAPRHARHGQPLHRDLPRRPSSACGSCCTRARAASATASAATSSSSRRRTCRTPSATCPTRTSPTSPRARSTSTTTSRPSSGRRTSR